MGAGIGMEILKRKNLSELVAGRIKQWIVENSLKPGDRLPTEQEMADRFGVSRVSVREATKALSFLGIIQAAPRRGLTVGNVDMRRVTEYLGFHLALTDYPKHQLLQTRLVIETGVLPFVARSLADDPSLQARLADLLEAARQATDDEHRIAADIDFHRELLLASHIEPLLVFNDLLQIFFNRFYQTPSDGAWEQTVEQHGRLIENLRDRDLESARQTLIDHLAHYQAQLSD